MSTCFQETWKAARDQAKAGAVIEDGEDVGENSSGDEEGEGTEVEEEEVAERAGGNAGGGEESGQGFKRGPAQGGNNKNKKK